MNQRKINNEKTMFILGGNSAGLMNKKESFLRNISIFKPAAYFIQESKLSKRNKILVEDYTIFEQIRDNSAGGGLLTAVHNALKPINVSEEAQGEEILVVEATIGKSKIRFINGYGPQESENEETRRNFYSRLDLEIKRAKISDTLICTEMDSKAKLGSNIIPDDPHPQSGNGKMLENVINSNNLKVVNGTDLCNGNITRKRTTINGTEESIIDHFIVCHVMYNLIVNLQIDQERKYCLTKFTNKMGNKVCLKESDHNTLILEISQGWNTSKNKNEARKEVLNYKNKEEFKMFIDLTNDSKQLKTCFDDENEELEIASKRWLRYLKSILKASFSKIRIKKGNINPKLHLLFQRKESIKSKIAKLEKENKFAEIYQLQNDLENIHNDIASISALKNKMIVDDYLGKTNDTIEGFNQAKTWGLTRKLCPKNSIDPPCAKKDKQGKLVTDRDDLEKLYIETYADRLKPNPIKEQYAEMKTIKEYLFNINHKIAQRSPSKDWNMNDLKKALKTLKNNKARDEHGHIYELFKYGGKDLKISLLTLLNKVKNTQTYPTIFRSSNISSIWKRKGEKNSLENDRGIFCVNKIRSILDKLIYNDFYAIIDESMSSSNIGGRKNRNIRDHLFIVNGIMNDVINSKTTDTIDLEIYDVKK